MGSLAVCTISARAAAGPALTAGVESARAIARARPIRLGAPAEHVGVESPSSPGWQSPAPRPSPQPWFWQPQGHLGLWVNERWGRLPVIVSNALRLPRLI